MNQRRVECLKRHRRDPELHSEQKGEGHWHSEQVLQWRDTQISNVEGERKNAGHLFNEKTAFYTSTAQ
jgi:hypothetical protein